MWLVYRLQGWEKCKLMLSLCLHAQYVTQVTIQACCPVLLLYGWIDCLYTVVIVSFVFSSTETDGVYEWRRLFPYVQRWPQTQCMVRGFTLRCFQNPLFLFLFNVGPYVQVLTITTVYSEKILLELHLSTITIVCDLGQIYILLILPWVFISGWLLLWPRHCSRLSLENGRKTSSFPWSWSTKWCCGFVASSTMWPGNSMSCQGCLCMTETL